MINLLEKLFDHSDIPRGMLDPDKAKYHFDKSGIGNTTVPIVAAEVAPGTIDQCLFLQREASKIGLNIDVKRLQPTDIGEPFG